MCNNTTWSHNINCLQVAIMFPKGSWDYPYIKISFQITHPAQKGYPHHRNLCPLLFMNSGVGSFQLSFTSHKNQISESAVRWDGLQCMVFWPYPRRLESITDCRCHYKGSTFFSVLSLKTLIVDQGVWICHMPRSRLMLSQLSSSGGIYCFTRRLIGSPKVAKR